MLGTQADNQKKVNKQTVTSSSKQNIPAKNNSVSESWGDMQRSCDRLVDEMLKKEKEHPSSNGKGNKDLTDDNYDEDDFENSYENDDQFEEDDYKLVDEEIMSTSIGKRDA